MIYTLVLRGDQTITLDSITNVTESYTAKATSHPVEHGAPITDHIVLENNKFSISGVVSDYNFANPNVGNFTGSTVTYNEVDDTFLGNDLSADSILGIENSIDKVKSLLIKTLQDREFIAFTRTDSRGHTLEEHRNCVIVGLSFSDDPDGGEAIYPKIDLEEIRLADLKAEVSTTPTLPLLSQNAKAADKTAEAGAVSVVNGKTASEIEKESTVAGLTEGQQVENQAKAGEVIRRTKLLDLTPRVKAGTATDQELIEYNGLINPPPSAKTPIQVPAIPKPTTQQSKTTQPSKQPQKQAENVKYEQGITNSATGATINDVRQLFQ